VYELESSLKQLEIKQEDVCTIWAYGALKSNGSGIDRKYGGINVIFSDERLQPVSMSVHEGIHLPKLSVTIVELYAIRKGLASVISVGWTQVEVRIASRQTWDILDKWLKIWKRNKWKKCNGSRLCIPVSLLKEIDKSLMQLSVSFVLIARGSCPEIIIAETVAKENCVPPVSPSLDQSMDNMTSSIKMSQKQCKQMKIKVVSTMKQRLKEKNRKKIKRLKFGTMKKRLQI